MFGWGGTWVHRVPWFWGVGFGVSCLAVISPAAAKWQAHAEVLVDLLSNLWMAVENMANLKGVQMIAVDLSEACLAFKYRAVFLDQVEASCDLYVRRPQRALLSAHRKNLQTASPDPQHLLPGSGSEP